MIIIIMFSLLGIVRNLIHHVTRFKASKCAMKVLHTCIYPWHSWKIWQTWKGRIKGSVISSVIYTVHKGTRFPSLTKMLIKAYLYKTFLDSIYNHANSFGLFQIFFDVWQDLPTTGTPFQPTPKSEAHHSNLDPFLISIRNWPSVCYGFHLSNTCHSIQKQKVVIILKSW